jgi:protein-disulfide isomerase
MIIIFTLITGCVSLTFGQELGAVPAWQRGNLAAKYQIEVFVDYECPACIGANEKIKYLQVKYPEDISLIYRHYPLTQIHKNAMLAAQATEAAGLQGKFWEMGDLLLSKQKDWKSDSEAEKYFTDYAKEMGLIPEIFKENLRSEDVKNRIDQDIKRAKFLSVTAIPSVFLNGKLVGFEELDNLEKNLFLRENK